MPSLLVLFANYLPPMPPVVAREGTIVSAVFRRQLLVQSYAHPSVNRKSFISSYEMEQKKKIATSLSHRIWVSVTPLC